MNAIISGKMEKQVGSMVFRSVRSLTLSGRDGYADVSDIQDPYLRLINKQGKIVIVYIPMCLRFTSDYATYMQSKSNVATSEVFQIYYNPPQVHVYIVSANYTITDHFSSYEIGTLEIS